MGPEFMPAKSTWSEDNDISLLKILDPENLAVFKFCFMNQLDLIEAY